MLRISRWLFCFVLLCAPCLHAQTPTPTPKEAFGALYPAVDQYLDKVKLHQRFTYTFLKQLTYSKANGKVYARRSDKFEQMYIGGLPYVRLLEENGKPLSGKAAQQEQERYDQAAKDRSGMSMGKWIQLQGHGRGVGYHPPLEELQSKFATQFLGRDIVDGNALLHFHLQTVSDAMSEPYPVSAVEMELWVDPATKSLVKVVYKLLANDDELQAGTTGTIEYFLVGDALCLKHSAVHYVIHSSGHDELLDSDTTYADYKKFTTTMKILPDTETVVP